MAYNTPPNLEPTKSLANFRFWCQKVLPLVYDDALSYYEVLGKMVQYLNDVIDDVNADADNINTLYQAFLELQAYVEQAIQYDIHDLEEAVATCIEAAQSATASEENAQTSATSASESASSALESAQQASGSAINAANSAINALEAQQQALGYASDANQSALSASQSSLTAISMADQASNYGLRAEGYAVGKQNGVDVGQESEYYQNNAKYYKEEAEDSADAADDFKDEANTASLKAEGMAVGKQNGVDVDSDSPYYHNNAKYYAEQAGQASGLSVSLTSLTDTDIQNPANGQALVYDSTAEKWVNSDEAIGVTSLDALTDTDIQNPASGQVLMYNGTEWENSAEKEIAISQNLPSDPATKLWIDETQQTPIQIPTMADLNSATGDIDDDIADINTAITNINTTLNSKANTTDVTNALNTKQNKPTIITQSAPTAITLADNYEYYLTNVSSLTFTYPSVNFECWIVLETASSGSISITFPNSEYIGKIPTFGSGEKWEISIKNGVIIAGKAE